MVMHVCHSSNVYEWSQKFANCVRDVRGQCFSVLMKRYAMMSTRGCAHSPNEFFFCSSSGTL